MKMLASILLSFVAVITGVACFWLSMCAVGGDGINGGGRASYAIADVIDVGVMIGAILLIGKLNKKKSGVN